MKCLDTYALVEIHNSNPRFTGLMNEDIVIPDIVLAEFYSLLYRDYGLQTADYWRRKLNFFCKPVSQNVLIKAVRYKYDNKKENLSFFDCVGYIYALENGMPFVTGDKEFEKKKNVEYIT